MTQPLHESARTLAEATTGDDSGLLEVEFITPGWGSSGYYSREVVEAAAPLFTAGTQMFFDHPSATENADRPERSVRDLAAVIEVAGAVDATTGGVRGKVRPLKAYKDLLTDEAFAKNVGLSIRGSASDITVGEAEGRRGPIIEGLADLTSVDFVTRAGRGGRVLAVLESAHLVEATADDRMGQLRDVIRATYSVPGVWAYVRDMDAEAMTFQFEVSQENGPSITYEQAYTVGDNDVDVTLTGDPIAVRRVTNYVPVTRPDSTIPTTEADQEVTMGNIQIEESEHRSLVERAGRVDTLESERDTAVQERDQLRTENAGIRARETAVTHARTRVTAANASLPGATVDRIVAEATRTVPLTEAGQLDTAALDTAVDTARTAEETYLAGLAEAAGVGSISGFGGTTAEPPAITEADLDGAIGGAFGRQVKEA